MIYLVAIKVLLVLGAAHSSRVHCTPHFCCHFGESSSRDAGSAATFKCYTFINI